MIVIHDAAQKEEHRVVITLTILEAQLWVRGNDFVRLAVLKGIKGAVSGCDHEIPR